MIQSPETQKQESQKRYLLWIDFETTGGAVVAGGRPIEVGAQITDSEFNLVGASFQRLIKLSPFFDWNGIDPVVRQMHQANGLEDEHREFFRTASKYQHDTSSVNQIDKQLWLHIIDTLRSETQTDEVTIAGSGVSHYDSLYLREFFPRTWSLCTGFDHYTKPTIDLGVIRRFLSLNHPGLLPPKDLMDGMGVTPHRALDDVITFIEQAHWYRRLFDKIPIWIGPDS